MHSANSKKPGEPRSNARWKAWSAIAGGSGAYHLVLLAKDLQGYRNLIQLSSLAFMEGYYYKPRMDWELLEKYSDGLIATTGCLGGQVLQALLNGDDKGAIEKARFFAT